MKEELNKETLKRLYITEQKSLNEIAKMFGRSYTFVRNRFIKHRIKLRPKNYKMIKFKKSAFQSWRIKLKFLGMNQDHLI